MASLLGCEAPGWLSSATEMAAVLHCSLIAMDLNKGVDMWSVCTNSDRNIRGMHVCVLPSQTTAWRLCPGVLSSLMSRTTSGQQTADRRTHHRQASRLLDAQQGAVIALLGMQDDTAGAGKALSQHHGLASDLHTCA
jgi:hypothetical protein